MQCPDHGYGKRELTGVDAKFFTERREKKRATGETEERQRGEKMYEEVCEVVADDVASAEGPVEGKSGVKQGASADGGTAVAGRKKGSFPAAKAGVFRDRKLVVEDERNAERIGVSG
jgi:hypothetical protein